MVGQTLSHYRVTSKLGQGGMGEVFLAQDVTLDRMVAIKVLPENFRWDDTARKCFLREARLAAALDHPYICGVHELLTVGDHHCIVMELVEGETLRQRLLRGALPQHDALRIGLEIAEALEKAHQKGIIHRDLKPANIMLTSEGHVKVMDFGLAKQLEVPDRLGEEETRSILTQAGSAVGTLVYMSREQLQRRDLTPESDLFALGVVLCEMLTGVHPFRKDLELESTHAIVHAPPSPSSRVPAGSPDGLQALLDTLLSKSPREKFRAQSRYSRQPPDAADVLAACGGRSDRSGRELAGLLCGAQEGWSSRRNTCVCEGRHAFGLRRTESPITGWPQLVETWLAAIVSR